MPARLRDAESDGADWADSAVLGDRARAEATNTIGMCVQGSLRGAHAIRRDGIDTNDFKWGRRCVWGTSFAYPRDVCMSQMGWME